MRHARVQFETTKNHLRKQITLKTGSGSSQKFCGRTDGGWTHTHDIFEGTYTISPGGQRSVTFRDEKKVNQEQICNRFG